MKRLALSAVLGLALVATSVAPADHRPSHSPDSKRCKPAKVAFVLKGTYVSHAGNEVTLDVTRANRNARRAGFTDPFTDTATRSVRLSGYEEGEQPDQDDRVRAVGKVDRFKRGCDNPTSTSNGDRYGDVTIRRFVIIDRDAE